MYFLYFIPDATRAGLEIADVGHVLADCGLNHLQASRMQQRGIRGGGPEDLGGMLLADTRLDTKQLYYKPAEQRWEKSINGKFWVGFYTDNPPTEKSLRREAIIDGHGVELLTGQVYTIPTARCYPAGTKFPRPLILTAAGLQYGPVNLQYRHFSDAAESLWQYFAKLKGWIESVETELETVDLWKLTAQGLGFNYFVGFEEINLLGLLSSVNLHEAALAIIDGPVIRQWEIETAEELKKNGRDGTNGGCEPGTDGGAAS